MRKIRKYIEELSFEELKEIMANHVKWEEKGAIGDCLLRFTSEKIMEDFNITDSAAVLWMEIVANDCYRLIAEKAIKEGFKF